MSNSPQHRERRRKAARLKHQRSRSQHPHWSPLYEAHRPRIVVDEFRAVVERLTNWQRSAWARVGYPGLRYREAEPVRPYADLKRGVAA